MVAQDCFGLKAWLVALLVSACPVLWAGQASMTVALSLPAGTQAGDLIFRRGLETTSDVVLAVDGGEFSHVGMLLGQAGTWQVIHATPPEVEGRTDGVVVDDLAFFLDPVRSQAHAVYHVQASAQQRAQAIQHALAERGKLFRMANPAGTYCTLLVWQAWRQAGLDLEVDFTWLALPLMQGDYLLPTPLSRSSHLRRAQL